MEFMQFGRERGKEIERGRKRKRVRSSHGIESLAADLLRRGCRLQCRNCMCRTPMRAVSYPSVCTFMKRGERRIRMKREAAAIIMNLLLFKLHIQ